LVVGLAIPTAWIATGFAAQDALPGDTLYGAKRAVEQTNLAFASFIGDKEKEVQLHVQFANSRANEVKRVMNDPGKKKQVQETVDNLKTELTTANEKLVQLKKNPAASSLTTQVAKDLQKHTGEINQTLQEVKQNLQNSSSSVDKNLSEEMGVAKSLAKDTDVSTIEAVVASHLNGNKTVTKEDVTVLINKNFTNAVAEVNSSEKGVEGVKIVVDSVKKEFASSTKRMYTTFSTTTKEFTQKITSVSEETNQAVKDSKVVSTEVDKKVGEAKELLINGDFDQAVGKLKEINSAAKQVEKISDTTIKRAQTVLPVVQVIKVKPSTNQGSTSSTLIISTSSISSLLHATSSPNTSSSFLVIPIIIPATTSSTTTLK
jgi:hypothetical protein